MFYSYIYIIAFGAHTCITSFSFYTKPVREGDERLFKSEDSEVSEIPKISWLCRGL